MQGQAEDAGDVEQPVGHRTGPLGDGAGALLLALPAAQQWSDHAERPHRLGLLQVLLCCLLVAPLRRAGGLLAAPGQQIVGEGDDEQRHRTDQRQPAEQRVHHPDDGNEDRHPGRVEKRQDGVAAEKGAQVADVGKAGLAAAAGKARVDAGADHRCREPVLQPFAGQPQEPPAGEFENAVGDGGEDRGHGQPHERVERAAGQHPVEHLQHVDGADQQEQVGGQAKHSKRQPLAAQLPLAVAQNRFGRQKRFTPSLFMCPTESHSIQRSSTRNAENSARRTRCPSPSGG